MCFRPEACVLVHLSEDFHVRASKALHNLPQDLNVSGVEFIGKVDVPDVDLFALFFLFLWDVSLPFDLSSCTPPLPEALLCWFLDQVVFCHSLQLLCDDGGSIFLFDYHSCNWSPVLQQVCRALFSITVVSPPLQY